MEQNSLSMRNELLCRPLSLQSFFVLIFSETICSWLSNGMLMVSLGWWAIDTKYRFFGSSLIESCFFIPPLLFGFWFGKLSDEQQPTHLAQQGTLLKLFITAILIFYQQYYEVSFVALSAYCLVVALGDTIVDPSITGYIGKVLRDREFAKFIAARPLLIDFSFMLGGLVVAPIYKWIGIKGVLGFILGFYFFANCVVFLLPKLQLTHPKSKNIQDDEVHQEVSAKISWVPLILFCLIVLLFGTVLIFFLFYSNHFMKEGIQFVSYLHGAFITGLAIAMLVIWKNPLPNNFGRKSMFGHLVVCLFLPLLFFGKTIWILPLIVFAVIGYVEGWIFMCLERLWIAQHPINLRGHASGQLFSFSTATRIIGLYSLGVLANYSTVKIVILFLMVYLLALTIYSWFQIEKINNLPSIG